MRKRIEAIRKCVFPMRNPSNMVPYRGLRNGGMIGATENGNGIVVRAQDAAVREIAYYLRIPGMSERIGAIVEAEASGDGFPLLEAIRREARTADATAAV